MIILPLHECLIPLGCGVSVFSSALDRSYKQRQLDLEERCVVSEPVRLFTTATSYVGVLHASMTRKTCCCSPTEGATLVTACGWPPFLITQGTIIFTISPFCEVIHIPLSCSSLSQSFKPILSNKQIVQSNTI